MVADWAAKTCGLSASKDNNRVEIKIMVGFISSAGIHRTEPL